MSEWLSGKARGNGWRRAAGIVALTAALGACVQAPPSPPPPVAAEAPPPPAPTPPPPHYLAPRVAPLPQRPPQALRDDGTGAPSTAEAAPLDLASLIGMDQKRAIGLFGQPASRQTTGASETWHYQDGSCGLDLTFFLDVKSRVYRTLSYGVTSDDTTDAGQRRCLALLRTGG